MRAKLAVLCAALAVCGIANAIGLLGRGSLANSNDAIPLPAVQAGFTTLTWNTTTIGTTTGTWQASNLEGCNTSPLQYSQNSNGSIYLSGYTDGTYTGCGNSNLDTAIQISGSPNWSGVAFGGGAYVECTLSFVGQGTGPFPNGHPACWTQDIEHMSQWSGYEPVTWPTGGCITWTSAAYPTGTCATVGGNSYFALTATTNQSPNGCAAWSSSTAYTTGQCATLSNITYFAVEGSTNETPPNATYWSAVWLISTHYNDFFEIDFMEYDVGGSSGQYCWQNGIGNWYDSGVATHNPVESIGGSAGSVCAPSGTDFSQPHKYGTLWITQTQGCSAYGYPSDGCLVFFFDGAQVGATFYWTAYSSSQLPPPANYTTAMNGMDARHMHIMIGTGGIYATTVYSMKVWQTSSANNLQY